jgi:hypothetical protein
MAFITSKLTSAQSNWKMRVEGQSPPQEWDGCISHRHTAPDPPAAAAQIMASTTRFGGGAQHTSVETGGHNGRAAGQAQAAFWQILPPVHSLEVQHCVSRIQTF